MNMNKKSFAAQLAVVSVALFMGACASLGSSVQEGELVDSIFIGRKMIDFEMHSGVPMTRKRLPNGDTIHFWRSDWAGYSSDSRDDGYSDRCDLQIRTNPNDIITQIRVLEWGMACVTAI